MKLEVEDGLEAEEIYVLVFLFKFNSSWEGCQILILIQQSFEINHDITLNLNAEISVWDYLT